MKRILFLAVMLLAATQAWTAHVDEKAAQAAAFHFIAGRSATGIMMAPAQGSLQLAHVEWNSKSATTPVYYIFNASNCFVIVAGDDRAQEVLAYGDGPIDMNNLPGNMKYWLSCYKRQMEFLQANPNIQVSRPSLNAPQRASQSVNPLITANWSQNAPYWNECPAFGTDTCYTGCPATSLAMVFHYWKYPKQQTPAVPSYQMPSYGVVQPELPPTVFDWSNMIDNYAGGNYTEAQATAVAHLMRYIGQAEEMDYTISGSGAYLQDILRAVKHFEYDPDAQMLFKSDESGYENYSDTQWSALIQNELTAGRPIVYCAYDNTTGAGHAFNVDGYDAMSDTYHINWGWNGRGNGNFALHAFTYQGYTFGTAQQMVIGIQPPEDYMNPRLQVYPTVVEMQSYINQTVTATISLKGTNLTDDVTLALNDPDGVFTVDAVTVARDLAEAGYDLTVTYSPSVVGNHTATIICTSGNTDPVTVTLNGTAPLEVYPPVMQPVNEERVTLTSFVAQWTDETPSNNVSSYTLEVQAKPAYSLLEEADFSSLPEMAPANQASHAADYLPEGWTFNGSEFNLEGGCVSLRRNSTITTDEISIRGYDKMTIEVTAKAYGFYGDGSELYVTTSHGTQELIFMYSYETKTIVVDCNETEQIEFKAGYYPMIQNIKIYAGDATQGTTLQASEAGDDHYRLVTGIAAGKSYTVKDLASGGSFLYHVKALYIDGTESDWSNVEMVTLVDGGHAFSPGDVDHDGKLSIVDVTRLIDYLLSAGEACEICADVNGDHAISILDVTTLIDLLLGN